MTTLIEDLQTLLNPLAAGGSWYMLNDQEPPTLPFIVFQSIVSPTNNSFQGPSNLQNTRVQIDMFGLRMSDVITVANAIESALLASNIGNVQLSVQDMYEPAVKLSRRMMEYSVWSTN